MSRCGCSSVCACAITGGDNITVTGNGSVANPYVITGEDGGAGEPAAAAHIADTSDAHDASAVSFSPAGTLVATDVQGAIQEVSGDVEAHLTDTTDAHDASTISIVDAAGDFTATDVEGALAELQTRAETDDAALVAHLADTSDAHDASAISFVPTGTIAATDVQAAIAEVAAEAGSSTAVAARVYQTTAQSIPNAVNTGILFDGEDHDASGLHSVVSDTSRFTIPTTGLYRLTGSVNWPSTASSGRYLTVYKNGVDAGIGSTGLLAVKSWVGYYEVWLTIDTGVISLNAGDYVELALHQSTGGPFSTAAGAGSPGTWFSIEKV